MRRVKLNIPFDPLKTAADAYAEIPDRKVDRGLVIYRLYLRRHITHGKKGSGHAINVLSWVNGGFSGIDQWCISNGQSMIMLHIMYAGETQQFLQLVRRYFHRTG